MKTLPLISVLVSAIFIVKLGCASRALGENTTSGNAKILLEEARENQSERKRTAMQKELDRVNEDVNKGKQEMEDLEKSMSRVGNAVAESKNFIDQLTGRKKHVMQDLEMIPLRIETERLKAEALNLLNSAHAKAVDALTKRNEELKLRAALVSAEIQKFSDSENTADSESKRGKGESAPSKAQIRKDLQKAEGRSQLANEKAREAMDAASLKFKQADAAAVKVEKKQAQIDLDNDPNSPAASEPLRSKTKKGL